MTVAALGIVFGDIGTSPLYAFREALHMSGGGKESVLGLLSLILWALILIVSVKYLVFVLRADHRGEGGILALVGLLFDPETNGGRKPDPRELVVFTALGVLGAALLYGDGMITPAISVLGAIEGIEFAAPQLHSWVVPISALVLAGLFFFQRFGTIFAFLTRNATSSADFFCLPPGRVVEIGLQVEC